MKKAALLLIATVALTACGTRTVVVQQPAATTKPPVVSQTPAASAEDLYIDAIIRERSSLVNEWGKNWLIEFGYVVCGSIDEGMTLTDLIDMASKTNADGEMVGILVRLAIVNICPRNQWFLDAATNA